MGSPGRIVDCCADVIIIIIIIIAMYCVNATFQVCV